eukprot:TRINITY_DN4322_c0_g1_i10.p1 TRINITY_DN4322_c0_g1~~TRINITY_DN4322_c0_g1_i10.p1  ORF type:complete len:412 (-),score=110.41 TRINITY_DN4322_c0_g1_i10:163-1350(-)
MLKRPGGMHGGGMGGYPGMMPPKRAKVEKKFSDKIGFRILLASKAAGCLIGKGGSTINKLRDDYNCSVRIPDCAGPERILEIVGEEWDKAFSCLEAGIPYLYECPDGVDNGGHRELRFLVHQAIAGAIIGKGGENIKKIRDSTGVNMKVYQNTCPQSTDRCVQIEGTQEEVMNAAREVYTTVIEYNLTAHENIYDPINYDNFYANEYGGFGSSSKGRRGDRPPPRGDMPPMGGGMRGPGGPPMGYGRGGGFGGRGGFNDDYMDEMGGPRGGMMGGPPGGRFGGGEFGWGGGEFGRGGGRSGGFGSGKRGPKLEFTREADDSYKTTIEKDLGGAIIGIGGQRIRKIRSDSGATIQIGNPENNVRTITVSGDEESTRKAKHLIQSAIYEFSAGPGGM